MKLNEFEIEERVFVQLHLNYYLVPFLYLYLKK